MGLFNVKMTVKPQVTHLLAFGTYERALVLPLEEIDYHTVVAKHITLPRLGRQLNKFNVTASFPIGLLDVGLLQNTIEVFMKTVEEKGHKLL